MIRMNTGIKMKATLEKQMAAAGFQDEQIEEFLDFLNENNMIIVVPVPLED